MALNTKEIQRQEENEMCKQNPCRYCSSANEFRGRHYPGKNECIQCEYRKQHLAYLETRRQFTEGEPINTLEELLSQEWVMWHHHVKHIEVIRSNQLRSIENWLRNGALRRAIRRENTNYEA